MIPLEISGGGGGNDDFGGAGHWEALEIAGAEGTGGAGRVGRPD